MEEKVLMKRRKRNMKLYPIYEMLGTDFLFYYGIQVLFLSQVKNIADSNILFASSLYAFFGIFLQIPISIFIKKVGARKALITGNVINAICITIVLVCPNFTVYIIEEFLNAIAFGIKGVTESSILDNSIPDTDRKGEIFTNIHSKGYSKYCYISAFSMVVSGMLYDINPYIPVVICLIFCILAILISYNFYEFDKKDSTIGLSKQFSDIKDGFKFIFRSTRLKCLLISIGFIWGLVCLFSTYRISILNELNCSATLIGIVTASYSIITGIMSTQSMKFHNKYRNRTLTVLMLSITISFILIGMISLMEINSTIKILAVLLLYIIIASSKGISQVIKTKYMGNFANNEILPLLYSSNTIIRNLLRMAVGFVGAFVLSHYNVKYAIIIVGIMFTAIVYVLYKYMKPRFGLKPEEYKEKDINFYYKKNIVQSKT